MHPTQLITSDFPNEKKYTNAKSDYLITMREICVPDNNTVSTNKHLSDQICAWLLFKIQNSTLLIVLNLGKTLYFTCKI